MTESSMSNSQEIESAPDTKGDGNINAIVIDIIGKLDHVRLPSQDAYICRVHHLLRSVNEKAYDPVLLSVGPYHYEKRDSSLKLMEDHKLRLLNQHLDRLEREKGISKADQLNNYLVALKRLEGMAKAYYAEAIDLEQGKFLEMMLLDGCFIIELFRMFKDVDPSEDTSEEDSDHVGSNGLDPLFKIDWILMALPRDLLLIENQLPFLVLQELHSKITGISNPLHLIKNALGFLHEYSTLPLDEQEFSDCKHLLDLVHKSMKSEDRDRQGSVELCCTNGVWGWLTHHHCCSPSSHNVANVSPMVCKYTATELRDMGVTFKVIKDRKFYEIKFKCGVLEMPIFQVEDDTEDIFRNLIAYEENAHGNIDKYVVDYMSFMDHLIGSRKDVELLRHEGIIASFMSSDKAISVMINRMTDNITITPNFNYKRIVGNLTKYCAKKRHGWIVALRRNHFNTPWAILSIVAAFILLVATLLQTIYTAYSYYHI